MVKFQTDIDKYKNIINLQMDAGNGVKEVKMLRWGWFEDNILTKYIAVVGDSGIPTVTFSCKSISFYDIQNN